MCGVTFSAQWRGFFGVMWRLLRGSNDESGSGGFNHVIGNAGHLVDFETAYDLDKEVMQEPEVAAGDACD